MSKVSGGVGGIGGVSGGDGAKVSMSEEVRTTIQNIREITGKQHSDEDVYAMLEACSMDPNETAQKHLYLDTFHEVKSKQERRREMVPRWKGKGSEAKTLENPMSEIVSQLKLSLIQSDVHGLLSGCSVLVAITEELLDIMNRSCFGRPLLTTEKDKGWFQLGLEEAFYLHYYLECLPIQGEDHHPKPSEDVWRYMKNRKISFPESYRAYSHLRGKNWVVRPGSQYGVDFVAYRHHPALVHSEYAVLVLKDGDVHDNGRLKVWSDFHCTVRLCGSVAKLLLVLYVNRVGHNSESPSSASFFSVEERLISRWSPKECREDIVGCESLL